MRKVWVGFLVMQLTALCLSVPGAMAFPVCKLIPEASFSVGGVSNLSASIVNPGAPVTGLVNAIGCDIGVYFSPGKTGSVTSARVLGARVAGIVNNGANVKVDGSAIYQIGDLPISSAPYGYGIYVSGQSARASGNITHNTIWDFQQGGIEVIGATALIEYNTVTGQGPTTVLAQRGIEVGLSSRSTIQFNNIFGMSYFGEDRATGAGIRLYGGPCFDGPDQTDTSVLSNQLTGNDIGIALNNLAVNCVNSDTSATKNTISYNAIRDNGVFNSVGGPLDGSGPLGAYQAGVSDQGKLDQIIGNSICGFGYTPQGFSPPYIYSVDTTLALSPIALLNKCVN